MKNCFVALSLLAVPAFLAGTPRDARADIGVGLSLGYQDGLTGELGTKGRRTGRGLGQSVELTANLDAYAHVAWKLYLSNVMRARSFNLPVYVGLGAYVEDAGNAGGGKQNKGAKGAKGDKGGKGDQGGPAAAAPGDGALSGFAFGARAPLGVAMEFRRFPAHLFLELALQAPVEDVSAISTHTGVGFRYFF
jgi:hypothetical protein